MMRGLLIVLFVLFTPFTQAHKLAPSLLELKQVDQQRFEVTWKTPLKSTSNIPLEPVFPDHCETAGAAKESVAGTARVLVWPMDCREALAGSTLSVEGMQGSGTATLFKIEWADGGRIQQLLNVNKPSLVIPANQTAWQVAGEYIVLGVEHIWLGIDHLLFVLALVLLVRHGRRLFWTITSFTVGHSITLSLVALGYMDYPVTLVEFAIAASIFVLAVELSRSRDPDALSGHWIPGHSWLVAVGFGLLHGMGFAGALSEVGLPQGDIPLALLSFNVGIELGQIAFVLVCLALMWSARHWDQLVNQRIRWASIYAIGSLSAFWCVERGLSAFS